MLNDTLLVFFFIVEVLWLYFLVIIQKYMLKMFAHKNEMKV